MFNECSRFNSPEGQVFFRFEERRDSCLPD
jgi:hypothetical protein